MTTAIRTTDKAGISGIISTGRPAGYWMAQSSAFPRIWTGAYCTGESVFWRHGSFGDVLIWLQRKAGILREDEEPAVRHIPDGPRWSAARGTAIPLRVEGAEIKDWPDDGSTIRGFDGTPVVSRYAELMKRARNNGGRSAGKRTTAEVMERDRKILELFREGKTYAEIAEAVGLTNGTVSTRIKLMQRADPSIEDGPRQHDQAQIMARDRRIVELARAGYKWEDIGRELGIATKTVSKRVQIMRSHGILIESRAKTEERARSAEVDDKIVALYSAGMQMTAISRVLGIPKRTICRRMSNLRAEGRIV